MRFRFRLYCWSPWETLMNKHFAAQKDKLIEFCKKHHIQRLAIFGSVLRDDFGPESPEIEFIFGSTTQGHWGGSKRDHNRIPQGTFGITVVN